ncbi:MAG: ABC transporter substrate-binding protein [Clostridiaceae bacterium]|nr:ABC transporter substrate-binding protein [Clostridiaceae bacterium]
MMNPMTPEDNQQQPKQEQRSPFPIRLPALAWRRHVLYGVSILTVLLFLTLLAFAVGNWQKTATSATETEIGTTAGQSTAGVPAAAFARGTTLTVGIDETLSTINPLYSTGDGEQDAVSLIFESLIRIDEQGQAVGQLADSWTYNAETHVLSVKLRGDHTFRDGRVVNVQDVLFTYQCLLSSSYDGPLKDKLPELLSLTADDAAQALDFQMAEWVDEPDYHFLTIGILKADYYACAMDRVYEMRDKNLPPEGSGSFYQTSITGDKAVLQLRPGYGGQVQTILLEQVESDDKYTLLQEGKLDIVRNLWNTRMQQRAEELSGYTFNTFTTSVDTYFLVNPQPQADGIIQRPSQRLAVLLTAAGRTLSELQQAALSELTSRTLILYYFQGVESNVLFDNRSMAEKMTESLRQAGLTVELRAVSWPDLLQRATQYDYDLLLLPATSNSRLPDKSIILQDFVQPGASALIANYRPEVFITCNRLTRLTINPTGHSYAAVAATWTDRIENIQFLNPDGSTYEEETP